MKWTRQSSVASTLVGSDENPSSKHIKDPGLPPDGGLQAYLQVFGGFFLFFNSWGLVNAFGEFQTYYRSTLIPGTSNSNISWIGSITCFLISASPLVWGPIFDKGHPRLLVLFGSFMVVLGLMMTSLCTAYWQLILAQGVCVGLGSGCLFLTCIAILPTYFVRYRALAIGVAASGSSVAGVIYPIVFHSLQPKIGFSWAVRVVGFMALFTCGISCATIRVRVVKPKKEKAPKAGFYHDTNNKKTGIPRFTAMFTLPKAYRAMFHDPPFNLFNFSSFFGVTGQYIPFFYIEQYATSHNLAIPFYSLTLLNTGSVFGRIIPGLVATKVHPLSVLGVCTSIAAILAYCWIATADSSPGLIVFCLLYGFFSGAFVSLQPTCVASIAVTSAKVTGKGRELRRKQERDVDDEPPEDVLKTIGARLGINSAFSAFGILIGNPVAGVIVPISWVGVQVFTGSVLLVSAGFTCVAFVVTFARERRVERKEREVLGVGQADEEGGRNET